MVNDNDIGFELLDLPTFQKYAVSELRRYDRREIPIHTHDVDDLLTDAGNDGAFGRMATIVNYGIVHATHGKIGFARIVTNPDVGAMGFGTTDGVWLGEIYITYDHRRKGYARQAIDALNVTHLIVKKHNVPARQLYAAMNFKQICPVAPPIHRSGSIEMTRKLSKSIVMDKL